MAERVYRKGNADKGEKVSEGVAARIRRGVELFAERAEGIRNKGAGVYLVPSCSRPNVRYEVTIFGDGEYCGCKDYSRNGLGTCKHCVAALIADFKRADYRVEERHDSRFGVMFDLVEYRGGRRAGVVAAYSSYHDALMAKMDAEGFAGVAA